MRRISVVLIIAILALMLFVATSVPKEKKPERVIVIIEKTDAGYDIYSPMGILLLEFHSGNTEPASSDTLQLIYDCAEEYKI